MLPADTTITYNLFSNQETAT